MVMLQTIHDKLKGIFAVAILVALGVVFVFWGVNFSTDAGGLTRAKGIEVNGREIPTSEVLRNYQDEMSRLHTMMGEAGVPEELQKSVEQRVVDIAVRTELLRQRTEKLRYQASDAEVLQAIREVPAFQVAGKFSKDAYLAALRSAGMAPERFEAEQRQYLLARQVDRALYQSAFVLPAELTRSVALRDEVRTVGWVTIPASAFEAGVQLDDEALRKFHAANQSRYMTQEQATVLFVLLDLDAFAAEADVSEEALRAWYEENRARYTVPGRRRARHILIAGDDAAAEARARQALERAQAGEDFAALARELSDDAVSKVSGGDLGEAQREDFVGPFAGAVWSMQPGEIRGPVKTEFGWHVIRLDSIAPEISRSFEDVRAELEPEFRRSRVEKAFGDAREQLDTLAFEAAGDLDSVAAKMNLPVQRVERFTRAGSPEIGSSRSLIDAVFSPEVLSGRELRLVELAPERVVALGVKDHQPSRARPFKEVRAEVSEAARLEAAGKLAAARAGEAVKALSDGADWPDTVAPWRSEAGTESPKALRRNDPDVPAEVREAAFRAPAPSGASRYGTAILAGGNAALWTVTAVQPGKLDTQDEQAQRAAHDQARDRIAMSDANVYLTEMRANADVEVNPQLFE
jgi:peptidyl-prolyl cis-trans isomerase D